MTSSTTCSAFLAERIEFAIGGGVAEERIWVDPGIGFGKTVDHNLELLRRLGELRELGRPIVVGTSRKSFLGKLTGREVGERLAARRLQRARAAGGARGVPGPRRRRAAAGARRRRGDPRRRPPDAAQATGRIACRCVEAHRQGMESSVEIEIRGLSIYTHHGVGEAEREVGQRLEIDICFDVPDCDAVLTDRLDDTVDYAEVCDIVALGATERSYRTSSDSAT